MGTEQAQHAGWRRKLPNATTGVYNASINFWQATEVARAEQVRRAKAIAPHTVIGTDTEAW